MKVKFKDSDLNLCQDVWNELDPEDRIQMSQYDLAKNTAIDSVDLWIKFLKHPQVTEQINAELLLYKEAQQRKLIAKANVNDKSTGAAQMLSALDRTMATDQGKSGDIIVYSYVPMNVREKQAPTATNTGYDVFEKEEGNGSK